MLAAVVPHSSSLKSERVCSELLVVMYESRSAKNGFVVRVVDRESRAGTCTKREQCLQPSGAE